MGSPCQLEMVVFLEEMPGLKFVTEGVSVGFADLIVLMVCVVGSE